MTAELIGQLPFGVFLRIADVLDALGLAEVSANAEGEVKWRSHGHLNDGGYGSRHGSRP
ncbi:hypothetical protein [Streptomyces sp. NPDC003635]